MSLLAAAVAGGAVGVRHAVETDHLAAVTTLVDDDPAYPGAAGASWGVGHTLPIAALGLLFVVAGVRLPASVTALFEAVVGGLLLILGGRLLLAVVVAVGGARHGGSVHRHLVLGDLSVGWRHSHLDGESFVVGVVHGFAGSGALVVALVSTAPSADAALAFLAAFSVATVATMAAVAAAWGRTLGTPLARVFRGAAGLAGVAAGVALLVGVWPPLP